MTHALPLFSILVALAVTTGMPARAAPTAMRRIAVLVGANDPSPGRPALRFAHDDATSLPCWSR